MSPPVLARELRVLDALHILATARFPNNPLGLSLLDLKRRLAADPQGVERRRLRTEIYDAVHHHATVHLNAVRRACEQGMSRDQLLSILRALWLLVAYDHQDTLADEVATWGDAVRRGYLKPGPGARALHAWLDMRESDVVRCMWSIFRDGANAW